MSSQSPKAGAGLWIGLGLILLAALLAFDTLRLQVPPSYARIGPEVFPWIATAGLTLCGLALMWQDWRAGEGRLPVAEATDWRAVSLITAGIAAQYFLIRPAGFVLSSSLLFAATILAFRSQRPWQAIAIGAVLSLVTYVVFTRLLGIQLPPGILRGIL